MSKRAIFPLLFLCLASISTFSQDYPGSLGCVEPLAHKIDEFDFVDIDDLRPRIKDLEVLLQKRGSEAKAVVHVYGGRKSRSDEIPKLIKTVTMASSLSADRLILREMGYRNQASIEIFILPLSCTSYPLGISDLTIEEADLIDLPSKRLSTNEISLNLSEQPETKCSPAGRAVRACGEGTSVEVFVVIDKKGNVVFSKSISAHPLNRANAEAASKLFKFRPFEIGGVASQVSGTIKIVYVKPEEIVAN